MFKRLSIIGLFSAWLCAGGALLDVAQVFAWARMFASYTRTMSVEEAAAQAVNPNKPCAICVAVQKARDTERRESPAPVPASAEKMLLAQVRHEPFIFLSVRPGWPQAHSVLARSWVASVPVPPPRTQFRGLVG